MAVVANPDLDSISAFTKIGNTVTATVSFTAVYAPSFVTNTNTYVVGKQIYISGSETPANDGEYVVTAIGDDFISYTNPNGVTQSHQFALASPMNLTIVKGLVAPLTVQAATPFSYEFSSPGTWNPPPTYLSTYMSRPLDSVNTGSTTHIITTATYPLDGNSITLVYPSHMLNNMYPYNFDLSLTLPFVASGGLGTLSFDFQIPEGSFSNISYIRTAYQVGIPQGAVIDSLNGVLYFSDLVNFVIRKLNLTTFVESIVATTPSVVYALALDQANQLLYASSIVDGRIFKINLATSEVTTERAGTGTVSAIGLAFNPTGNKLYIANFTDSKIVSRNLATGVDTDLVTGLISPNRPDALALDSANNKLYHLSSSGVLSVVTNLGDTPPLTSSVVWTGPNGSDLGRIAVDSAGLVYASIDKRIYTVTSGGVGTIFAGSGSDASVDGIGIAASFTTISGLAVDTVNNNLYATQYQSSISVPPSDGKIREILLPSANVSTLALATFPAGSNQITLSGRTYFYSTAPTITLVPGADAVTYRIGFNGVLGPSVNALGRIGGNASVMLNLSLRSQPGQTAVFDYFAPLPMSRTSQTVPEAPSIEDGGSSTALLPFIDYQGTTATIAAPQGFRSLPSGPLTYVLRLIGSGDALFETYSNTITVVPVTITSTPNFPIPFSVYTYTPFSYVFSAPGTANITLSYSNSTANIFGYLSSDATEQIVNFNSVTGSPTAFTGTLTVLALTTQNVLIGVLTSPVTFLPASIVTTRVIPSPEIFINPGTQIDLYKYEPFNYVFTVTGFGTPVTLQYNRSSAQLLPYITSVNSTSIAFAGTPPASYASTFNLVIDLIGSGGITASTVSYPVTISAARLIFTPPSPYLLDKFTNLSNTLGSVISISGSNLPTSLFSTPGLPAGLSFSGLSIVGTPQIEQTARNYLIIGSNSTTTQISTANISIRVGPSAVRILPSSVSFTSLSASSTPTATFTSILPDAIYKSSFVYTWDRPLPSGLVFTNSSGVPLPFPPFAPSDPSQSINLSGSPDLTDASGFPSSGLVTVVLSGIYRDIANVQTVGQSILNFQFAETVFMSTSVSPTIYVGKQLEPTDVVVTAASFFPNTSPITTFIITGLPPELTVQVVSPTQRRLVGTPLTAGTNSYTATATNANGVTKSIALVVTVNPNTASFSSSTPPNGSSVDFIVSRPLSLANPIRFFASSTSDSAVTYSSSLDFAAYGLAFSSSTGELTGTPTSSLIATPVTVTATDTFGATATTELNVTIDADEFTFPTATFQFFQNRAITPYQFVVTTTSGRPIQSFSSTSLPPGLFLGPSGLLMGTFTGSTNGNFTVNASTGYQLPPTSAQTYTYTAVPDNLLTVQVNGVDTIGTVFSNVQYRTLQYSADAYINPVYSVAYVSPATSPEPILNITQSGFLSGDFTGVASFPSYTAAITASYQGVTSTTTITFQSNTVFIPSGFLDLVEPAQSNSTIYQYVPYSFPVRAAGSTDFIYYFAEGVPVGFTFTLDPTGTFATLSGISPSNGATDVTFYAKTASAPATKKTFRLNTVIPFFVNQQIGAAAYTALVRKHVDADAAQNARDNKVFPEVNPLAGPFMAPHAPDTVTLSNCFLGLCKKPCPTCRTTM